MAKDSEFQNFSQLLATPFTKDVSTNINSPSQRVLRWNNAYINTSCARVWQRKKNLAKIFKNVRFKIYITRQPTCLVLATPYTARGGEVGHYTVVAGTRQWLQGRRNSLNRSSQPTVVSTYPPTQVRTHVSQLHILTPPLLSLNILSHSQFVLLANGRKQK